MDQIHIHQPASRFETALARLFEQAGPLAAIAGVFVTLTIFGGLGLVGGLVGFVAVSAAVLLLPPRADAPLPVQTVSTVQPVVVPGSTASVFADALIDPCMVLDRRAVVLHTNPAAKRQFPSVTNGNPLTFSLRNPELVQAIDAAIRTGATRSIELHETLPSETWDKVVVAPLTRPELDWFDDENRQLIVTFQSLTEIKRAEALRSDFIANASHELRTPLASLLGFIDTLLGPAAKDTAAREKFLGIMRGQAERMSKLIDDLLSLSRIEMHQHVRPTGSIDLAALLREVREGLMTQAKAADIEIRFSLGTGPATTMGDRGQLYEVFENLLDNAIKYGAGGKFVEVSLAPAGRVGFQHMVTVIDHGQGVEPEHVPRLTERFYRIDADASRKKKGTGLGLAIVKHIVNRHRGQLSIKSKPGEGMRVDVLLP
ncbi:GHKL domain-containing protein [Devosia sp. BSSL-BM10]|uniref:histidine kinase n=1 Tax=Devosia litorisediminis TaxID=2829817 RepID=A0A942ED05_9HYPH|nr:ATP-binding protein [Devosia litorisediminis]MBS3849987.1 GHKL domain-containing protein [Devosia litorisediminis]